MRGQYLNIDFFFSFLGVVEFQLLDEYLGNVSKSLSKLKKKIQLLKKL